jgi:hypothetical protein
MEETNWLDIKNVYRAFDAARGPGILVYQARNSSRRSQEALDVPKPGSLRLQSNDTI